MCASLPLYGAFAYDPARYGYEPTLPKNLRLFKGDGWIRIELDPNPGSYVDEYLIERSIDGGPWQALATVLASSTSYTDEPVENGRVHVYRLRAADDALNNPA